MIENSDGSNIIDSSTTNASTLNNSTIPNLKPETINNNSLSNTSDINSNPISNPNLFSDNLTKVSDGAIMAAAITAASKLSTTSPSIAKKIVTWGISTVVGAGAIVAKNMSSNLSSNLGKPKNFISDNPELIKLIENMFNLTGNDAYNLWHLIQVFQLLQIYIIIIYDLILFLVNESLIETFLLKVFPLRIVNYYIKSIKLLKKFNKFSIPVLFKFLLCTNWYSYYYLNFFYWKYRRNSKSIF